MSKVFKRGFKYPGSSTINLDGSIGGFDLELRYTPGQFGLPKGKLPPIGKYQIPR